MWISLIISNTRSKHYKATPEKCEKRLCPLFSIKFERYFFFKLIEMNTVLNELCFMGLSTPKSINQTNDLEILYFGELSWKKLEHFSMYLVFPVFLYIKINLVSW